MPRSPKVYTRTGDRGTTALAGGARVSKDALQVEAYGTVDELNALLGAARVHSLGEPLDGALARIQGELFELGADLSRAEAPGDRGGGLGEEHVQALERLMDDLSEELEPLRNFILPGGSPGAAALHLARTVCRRAERLVVALHRQAPLGGAYAVPYLNRLSDALFVMAREANRRAGAADVIWKREG